ncbi:MAG TPA: SDR family oxidoreductase [Parapedobacter sp.]|nr:SDR family oxidoreductase [Parapedobacter sp.]
MGWNLKGRLTLVAGGSKGIGKAIVSEFLELGATVMLVARNQENIDTVESELKNERLLTLRGDVTDATFRKTIAQSISKSWGRLDVLVNNAGMNIRKPSNELSNEELQQLMDLNLYAPFLLSRELYPQLIKGQGSSVINISSVAGLMDAGTGAPYGMSKSGLLQLTRSLSAEWANRGIRVNTVSPWFTRTPATRPLLDNPQKLERIVARTPLGRAAFPAEIAAAVAFLAMEKASFITGQNIIVDGGATSVIL